MSQQRNPRFWASQWYSTKSAKEPWPGGWYWHDEQYNWSGPFEEEDEALNALRSHETEFRMVANNLHGIPREEISFSLYYHPLSIYSQKVLIAIYEKGLKFERQIVNLMDEKERAQYREIYPMGKIPLLVLNHGPLIPESSIIIEYLDGLGGPRLISEDPDVARKTRFKDRMFDLYLSDPVTILFFQSMKSESEQNPDKMLTARTHVNNVYDFLENEIQHQTWANGEEFSMSDCAAAAALFYAHTYVPFDKYPNIKAYSQRLSARPSVQRVQKEAAPYLEAFEQKHAS